MLPSVHTFLDGIIDYAGLFPPAKLPLDQAILSYFDAKAHAQGFLVSRFVLPTKLASELPVVLKNQKEPFCISWLLDGAQIAPQHILTHPTVNVESIEIALPTSLTQKSENDQHSQQISELLDQVELHVARLIPNSKKVNLFVEHPWSLEPSLLVGALPKRCAKLRTGGTSASQVPLVSQLASAIYQCAKAKIPIKFTAGLHQPLRHFDSELQTDVYGFFNVFFASFGAALKNWTIPQIEHCLLAQESAFFDWQMTGVQCNNSFFSIADISEGRARCALSFGSCSFIEPVEYLTQMGLLN